MRNYTTLTVKEALFMFRLDVHLKDIEAIKSFVNITNRYPYTILLRQGRYLVDAKSVLGVCSLHHATPIQMEIYSDNCHELVQDLNGLIC